MERTVNDVQIRVRYEAALGVLAGIADESVDAVVTDPPYGLTDLPPAKVIDAITRWAQGDTGFVPGGKGLMGLDWDRFVPPPALWAECLRVLKPGGWLVAFAGSRTVDLMGLSIRFGGFEVKDLLAWLSGQGMPKVGDQAKAAQRAGLDGEAWAGLSSTLKPALDPVVLARKPMGQPLLANLAEHGTGALNIGACRIEVDGERPTLEAGSGVRDGMYERSTVHGSKRSGHTDEGRWPTNVLLSHGEGCAPTGRHLTLAGDGRAGKQQSFGRRSGFGDIGAPAGDPLPNGRQYGDETVQEWDCQPDCPVGMIGVDRAKVFPRFVYASKVKGRRQRGEVEHPTRKPVDVMDWLVRLACPQGGVLLDPFIGSGATVEAAVRNRVPAVVLGCELNPVYEVLLAARLDAVDAERTSGGIAALESA